MPKGKKKIILKRKYQNQTQTGHGYWSYQTEFKIPTIRMLSAVLKDVFNKKRYVL